jgi:RNA polymerase sigma-70 factor (ECF subfamily)
MVAQPEADVTAALRAGDETVYARLVRTWSPALVRTAMALTGDRAAADSVVQATWLRLPGELDGYQPPPELWGWVCGLLLGQLGLRAGADEPAYGAELSGPTVDRSRFLPPTHPHWPGHWQVPPAVWPAMEDVRSSAHGVGTALRAALNELPPAQRVVVGLRDVAGCEVAEITVIVGQPPEQVRDLLHRGRARLRRRIERHLADAQPA